MLSYGKFAATQPLSKSYILAAINDIDSVEIETMDENGVSIWDNEDCKTINFRFLETMDAEALSELIFVSKDIPIEFQIDKKVLAEYLWNSCDKNAFITLDKLIVIWSEPDNKDTLEPSDFVDEQLTKLYEEYNDEYAFEIGQDVLGQLWFERNIAVVNMGEIVRAAREVERENSDLGDSWFSFENQLETGFLTTIIHELRHLQMDTNFLLPEDVYPLNWASEEAVEEYCRVVFEENVVPVDLFSNLYDKIKVDMKKAVHLQRYNGFYKELDELRREDGCEDADFGFLENVDVGEAFNLYDFLHGHCDEFAAALSDYYGYSIEYIVDTANVLVHAYCVAEVDGSKAYIDARGITTDDKLFFEEFEDFCTYKDGCFYDLRGECQVLSHKDTREMYSDNMREPNQDKDLVRLFKENNSYYDVKVFERELKQINNVGELIEKAVSECEKASNLDTRKTELQLNKE